MAEAISSRVLAARVRVSLFTERCLQVYQRGLPADMSSCSQSETSFGCVRGDERAFFMVRVTRGRGTLGLLSVKGDVHM